MHGFGMRLIGSRALRIEVWEQGECKASYNPSAHEELSVTVEVFHPLHSFLAIPGSAAILGLIHVQAR